MRDTQDAQRHQRSSRDITHVLTAPHTASTHRVTPRTESPSCPEGALPDGEPESADDHAVGVVDSGGGVAGSAREGRFRAGSDALKGTFRTFNDAVGLFTGGWMSRRCPSGR